MGEQKQDADEGGEPGGEHRAKDPHIQRKDEEIIQHHVGKTAANGGHHGKVGVAVVADEADQHIVEQKGRGEQEHHLQISPRHGKNGRIRPQQAGEGRGAEQPGCQE